MPGLNEELTLFFDRYVKGKNCQKRVQVPKKSLKTGEKESQQGGEECPTTWGERNEQQTEKVLLCELRMESSSRRLRSDFICALS